MKNIEIPALVKKTEDITKRRNQRDKTPETIRCKRKFLSGFQMDDDLSTGKEIKVIGLSTERQLEPVDLRQYEKS